MPSFQTEVPHELGKDEAIARLKSFSVKIRETYKDHVSDIQESWTEEGTLEFSFSALGFAISGELAAADDWVKMTGSLPFAAVAFRGRIQQEIKSKLDEILNEPTS